MKETKKIFYAFNVHAPWPESYPEAKILETDHRHMTLSFLGLVHVEILRDKLLHFPLPSFSLGPCGYFDSCIALPKETPNVVAWTIKWLTYEKETIKYQKQLSTWIKTTGYKLQEYPSWLAHVTIARRPNSFEAFQKAFSPLPFYIDAINIYESLGDSKYHTLISKPLIVPIEKMPHTADIAYIINGENYSQLYRHAKLALSFEMPEVLQVIDKTSYFQSIEEIVIALNHIVTEIDISHGASIKAVSFHGKVEEKEQYLTWEMIIDV